MRTFSYFEEFMMISFNFFPETFVKPEIHRNHIFTQENREFKVINTCQISIFLEIDVEVILESIVIIIVTGDIS